MRRPAGSRRPRRRRPSPIQHRRSGDRSPRAARGPAGTAPAHAGPDSPSVDLAPIRGPRTADGPSTRPTAPTRPPQPGPPRPGLGHVHHRGPGGAGPVRRRLAGDRSSASGSIVIGADVRRRHAAIVLVVAGLVAAVDRPGRRRGLAGHRAPCARRACRTRARRRSSSSSPRSRSRCCAVLVVGLPLAALGIAVDGPLGRLALGRRPGARLHRAHPAARRRHRGARAGRRWASGGRIAAPSASWPSARCWAVPVIVVTIPIAAVLLTQIFRSTPVSPAAADRRAGRVRPQPARRRGHRADRRGAAVPGLRDDGVGPRARRRAAASSAAALVFAARPRHHDLREHGPGEAAGLAIVGFATRVPGRPGARLAVRAARLDLGVDRPARGVQRHPARSLGELARQA